MTVLISLLGSGLLLAVGAAGKLLIDRIDRMEKTLADGVSDVAKQVKKNESHYDKLATSMLLLDWRVEALEDEHPTSVERRHPHPGQGT